MSLRLESLIKSKQTFDRFRAHMQDDQDTTAAIKAFEMCYELCWKIMKRILVQDGEEITTSQSIFRKAALKGLIDDPELWFEFQDKRNLAVHTYNEENIEPVTACFYRFSVAVDILITRIQDLLKSDGSRYDL